MIQHNGKFITYLRVKMVKQGDSEFGLEVQRNAILDFLNGGSWDLLAEYVEVESGKNNDRTELSKAIDHSRLAGATLLIAKLDHLSRNAHFLISLQDAGVQFLAVDMPFANDLTVSIMAMVAQEERKALSIRTKVALLAAKERGVRLGCPTGAAHLRKYGNVLGVEAVRRNANERAQKMVGVVRAVQKEGIASLTGIADELNRRNIATARGGRWHASTVRNLLARIDNL